MNMLCVISPCRWRAEQIHALLGPNGAGKTTLMRLITGQLRGYQGSILIYGNKND